MQNAAVRLGVLGCGFVTVGRHLPALRHVPEVEVLAVADTDRATLEAVADRFAIPRRYDSAEALLAAPDLDAVAVCVPTTAHADLACAALEAGLHVLVEKPLAGSLEEADRIVECAQQARGRAIVDFNLRRHRFVERARDLAAAGALGELLAIDTSFTSPAPELGSQWQLRRAEGGGAIMERAIHHLDLWRHLSGREVQEVSAVARSGASDDEASVVSARLDGGAIATTVTLNGGAVTNNVAIHGTTGSLQLDLARFDGFHVLPADGEPGSPRARLRRLAEGVARPRESVRAIRRGGDYMATYEDQWRRFVAVARGELAPDPSLLDGRRALRIALAAIESADAGAAVRLDDEVAA